jgi:hypothetical protein
MDYLDGVLGRLVDAIVDPAIRLIFALALAWFFWGVFKFIRGAGDETARKTGRDHMLWGIVGMAIMVSVKAIIELTLDNVGVTPDLNF